MKRKKINNYSISKTLRDLNKSNEAFEILLNNLSLEELIALKFELAYKSIGFPLHGFPIWRSFNYIVKDALLKYALSSTSNTSEASKLLGLERIRFYKLLKKYNIKDFYNQVKKDDN